MPTRTSASRTTVCQPEPLLLADLGRRQVVADFSGGYLSSDGGALLLRQVDASLGLTAQLAQAFTDQRDQRYCDHSVRELLAQRLFAEDLGDDDLNDHATLRLDPLLAVACNQREPLGPDRRQAATAAPAPALAAPATLQRLEQGHRPDNRYHKIHAAPKQVAATLLTLGGRGLDQHAREIVLDCDALGHLVHGLQEGGHFNGYYERRCLVDIELA